MGEELLRNLQKASATSRLLAGLAASAWAEAPAGDPPAAATVPAAVVQLIPQLLACPSPAISPAGAFQPYLEAATPYSHLQVRIALNLCHIIGSCYHLRFSVIGCCVVSLGKGDLFGILRLFVGISFWHTIAGILICLIFAGGSGLQRTSSMVLGALKNKRGLERSI